jgi:hypothetical protein
MFFKETLVPEKENYFPFCGNKRINTSRNLSVNFLLPGVGSIPGAGNPYVKHTLS